MKKFLLIPVFLMLFSCVNSLVPIDVAKDEVVAGVETTTSGSVVINFPSTSKGLLTGAIAQSALNNYVVYVFDPASNASPISVSVPVGVLTAKVNVPVGKYSVLVIAVSKMSCLLAADEAKGVIVEEAVTTPVTITLRPINLEFSLITAPQVGSNSTMVIHLKGNAALDSILVSYFTLSVYDTTKDTPTTIGLSLPTVFSGTPTSQYDKDISVPLTSLTVTETTTKVSISGQSLSVREGNASFGLSCPYFLGYRVAPEAIVNNYIVTFSPRPATGIGIGIGWGEDY